MEWSLMNPIRLVETDLGFLVDGVYVVSSDCEETLLELLDLLATDTNEGSIRRQIWNQNLITQDLVPLLIALEQNSPLAEYAIKILSLLTQPLDLLTGPHSPGSPEARRQKVVSGLLQQAGKACWNVPFLLKVIVNEILLRINQGGQLNPKDCETINYCLLLIRNLFYHKEIDPEDLHQHQKLLIESGVDQLILSVLQHPQKILFSVAIVQVLSFLFKGHEQFLYKSISKFTELSISPELAGPVVWFKDDTVGAVRRKFIESIMDTLELHPPSTHDSQDNSSTSQQPTESQTQSQEELNDLGMCLLRFLRQFLADHYTSFIGDLLKITISSGGKIFDNLYLVWSLSFFLRFATHPSCFSPQLIQSIDVNLISYLVYVMVENTERLHSLELQNKTCTQTQQKLHLTLLSLLNLFRLMNFVKESDHLNSNVSVNIQGCLAHMVELRDMFILILRHSQCTQLGVSYLKDLIITNHLLLLLLEKWGVEKLTPTSFSMLTHVKQFASVEIMGKYGHALENFDSNDNVLNDSILTMMHHIAGDCGKPESLMQLSIMRTFTNIWDQKHLLSQDFHDLIEYVMERFISMVEEDPIMSAQLLFGTSVEKVQEKDGEMKEEKEERMEETKEWTSEEHESLMTSILNLQESNSILTDLKMALEQKGFHRTEDEIDRYVIEMGWLPSDLSMVVDSYIKSEDEQKMQIVNELSEVAQEELLPYLVDKLRSREEHQHLHWLQDSLLHSAEAKYHFMNNSTEKIQEPIRRMCSLLKKDFPIIMISADQEKISRNIYFFALLNELQLKSPDVESNQTFWRIPFEWSPSEALHKAEQLGPISYDTSLLSQEDELAYRFYMATTLEEEPVPEPDNSDMKNVKMPATEWMNCVQEANKLQEQQEI